MTNHCRGCTNCVTDARDMLEGFLKNPPETTSQISVECYKTCVRLAWRVEQTDDHSDAGWHLQVLLDGWGDAECLERVRKFERENPVEYPRYLRFLQETIERARKNLEPDS